MNPLFRIASVFAISALWSSPALATSTGITGQSGKDGTTCNTCHRGGAIPTVALEGPATLEPGATGQYTFIIQGGAAKTGGLNIAVDNAEASLQAGATGMKKLGTELTHSAAQPFTAGELRFSFTLVAPAKDVTLKLFAAGNSSNGDLGSDGDRAAATQLSVTVGKGTPVDVPGEEEEEEGEKDNGGGCAAAGSAPAWGLLLAGLALFRRRRS
ncbi:MXAN_6652 family MXYO-CTERM-anchored protein [Hyalangium gracile]|uniref:MXAN_6652 family MXYO-CTERM-anchored protein n=1 Tax=Hyalangium gracile TaxID=394092 RepID=UPI001CCA35BA|nr:MXAN_6652 family MXYO-CTERM-anchored protein [Hyalangium gracile]